MDVLGSPDRAGSRRLGTASYAVLYLALDRLLDAGIGAVTESNFSHGIAEDDLMERVELAQAAQVHCHATPEIIRQRYVARAESGQWHAGLFDTDAATLAALEASLASTRHQLLDLAIPLLRVDTSNGYAPSMDAILAFIARVGGRHRHTR